MSGWTKLFSTIVGSSVWMEDDKTLRVWIGFLALADREGIVAGTPRRMAEMLRVGYEDFDRAIEVLSNPDPESSSPDNEGRRIRKIDGGWFVLNHAKYRARAAQGEGSRAPYFRDYRKRKKEEAERATFAKAGKPSKLAVPARLGKVCAYPECKAPAAVKIGGTGRFYCEAHGLEAPQGEEE
jgi:hypothetical protein